MVDRRILVVALILGSIAAGLAVAFLASATPTVLPSPEPMTSVIVARDEIPVGTKIAESMVEAKQIAASAVVADAATDLTAVLGVTARYPIARGEQLSASRLVAPPKVQALSFQIPEGMRAFTIPVSTSLSPAALFAPGDFVDVLVAMPADRLVTASTVSVGPSQLVRAITVAPTATQVQGSAVATLLQNVQVLTVQRAYVADGLTYEPSTRGTPSEDGNVSYVTLGLTPEQAQLVWLAEQEGKLTLTLRAFGDAHVRPVGGVAP